MLSSTSPYGVWSVWTYLSAWERLFLIALGGLVVYGVFSIAVAFVYIHKAPEARRGRDCTDFEAPFAALRKRAARLQNLITVAFYVFGTVLFLGLQRAYIQIGDGPAPFAFLVLMDFQPHFVYAYNVFLVFFILRLMAWFVSACAVRPAGQVSRNP